MTGRHKPHRRMRHATVIALALGGVAVFDPGELAAPERVSHANKRELMAGEVPAPDGGPEVVRFVPAGKSPNGEPVVVVASEVSGTVTLWRVSERYRLQPRARTSP